MALEYIFPTKDDSFKNYRLLSSILFFANSIFLGALGFYEEATLNKVIFFIAAVLLLFYAVVNLNRKKGNLSFIAAYVLMIAIWLLFTPYYFLAIALAVFLLAQWKMEIQHQIGVKKEGITIKAFSTRHYRWNEFENIVLNGGLLTLDFTNNKVLQIEPDWALIQAKWPNGQSPEFYRSFEKDFNEFCTLYLNQ